MTANSRARYVVLRVLAARRGSMALDDLCDAAGLPSDRVAPALLALVRAGYVLIVGATAPGVLTPGCRFVVTRAGVDAVPTSSP